MYHTKICRDQKAYTYNNNYKITANHNVKTTKKAQILRPAILFSF